MDYVDFSALKGKILTAVEVSGNEAITFFCEDGAKYKMFHNQDCCEDVTIDDICGDFKYILGSPILIAEEVTNGSDSGEEVTAPKEERDESWTWTFYKIGTFKGFVTIRWYGTSNGFYSESVSFKQI